MKKVLAGSVVVLMVLFLSAGLGLARNGAGGGNGVCDGTGISLVCSGDPVEITGTVSDESYLGNGLQIDTGSEIIAVYGIGPYRFWENAGVARPSNGEAVTVDAMKVTFSDGSTKIIAMSITFGNGTVIDLREECIEDVGGRPLWRGGRNSN